MTTTRWREGGAAPPDHEPPVISAVSASQAPVTVATGSEQLPVFTPNDDGLSDTIKIKHVLSEPAFLDVRVYKEGNRVRRYSVFSLRGAGSTTWNGRRDDGNLVGEGNFRITITPSDRAGNKGDTAAVRVRVLSSIKKPTVNPGLFDPTDGDELASTTALKARLIRPGTVSWLIRDKGGNVVRRGIDAVDREPGDVRFVWDGTDDDGQMLPQGKYTGRIRVTRPGGTYGHDVTIRMTPFRLRSSKWTIKRGQTAKLTIESAEPLKGEPLVTANQPGKKKFGLTVKKVNDKKFTAVLKTRTGGKAGEVKIRIKGTDKRGGVQWVLVPIKLR
jgi:flagellar hook assembly protein FlgD